MDAAAWYSRADEYVERCFAQETPPRAGELAMFLDLTPSTLSRRFSRATGIRLIDYMRNRKLQHAARLLIATDRLIDDVGRSAGFGSRSSFFREFCEIYAVSPGRYRTIAGPSSFEG